MKPIFITATGTDVGKTHTALMLIDELSKRGLDVGVYKPIETGVDSVPKDANRLLSRCQKYNTKFATLTTDDITAYTFSLPAAPFCADRDKIIDMQQIVQKSHELQSLCDILLIEGAGGLMVPVSEDYLMVDLGLELNANVLIVTPDYLGCINETLLSIEVAKKYDLKFDWCVNLYQNRENFGLITEPYYDAKFPNWWSIEEGIDGYVDRLFKISAASLA